MPPNFSPAADAASISCTVLPRNVMSAPLLSTNPRFTPFSAAPPVIAPVATLKTPSLSVTAEITSRNPDAASAAPFKNSLSATTDARCSYDAVKELICACKVSVYAENLSNASVEESADIFVNSCTLSQLDKSTLPISPCWVPNNAVAIPFFSTSFRSLYFFANSPSTSSRSRKSVRPSRICTPTFFNAFSTFDKSSPDS